MLTKLRILRYGSLMLSMILIGLTAGNHKVQAQDFMSPYEPDSNTVLLMHFDGNFTNESPLGVPDGHNHGDSYGFVNSKVDTNFGKMLYLDNSSPNDTTGVMVPDHDELDLTGNWTIEAWVNILTYGQSTDDWRWRPRFVIKPHGAGFARFNYNLLARGDFRSLRGNYRAVRDSIIGNFGWLDTDTSPGSFQAGTWYHLTFIRDSKQHVTGLLLHDIDGNLIEFASRDYDPDYFAPPVTTDAPLNIGMTKMPDGSFQNAFVDGFIDEIRISNIIRNVNTPPIISNVTRLRNKMPNTPIEVTATAKIIPGSEIDKLSIKYNAGNGWKSASMTKESDSLYSGTIPGQPGGTTVSYYVSGTAKNGLSANAPNGVNAERGPYMNFAVQDTGKVLHLDFEDQKMPPNNKGNTGASINWTVGGQPQIVDDGANGTSHSMYLEGDSSHLSIGPDSWKPDYTRETDAAIMKNEDFVIDFWTKADSVPSGTVRWVIKEGQDRGVFESWNNFTYQVWTFGGGNLIPASYYTEAGEAFNNEYSGNVTGFDTTITGNKWYRVVYVVKSSDTTYTQLYNANNEMIDEQGAAMDVRVYQSNGPFRIGAYTPALEDTEVPFGQPDGPLYQGWIDELKYYNYIPDAYKDSTMLDVSEPFELPEKVTLKQNYPNPFNPKTKISYQLPRSSNVTLKVFDVLGRQVATLVDRKQQPGSYTVTFRGNQLSSGVYFYRLETNNTEKTRKMLLLK